MATLQSTQFLRAEDLYSLPDDERKYELQAGVILSEPTTGGRHGRVSANLIARLVFWVRRHKLGVVYSNDTGYLLARNPDTVRGPDISFLTKKRFDEIEDDVRLIPGAPDLAIETVSPSDTPSHIHAKVGDYLAAGTRLVWIVDPGRHEVTVYTTLLAPVILKASDRLDGGELLPGFSVRVAELFRI